MSNLGHVVFIWFRFKARNEMKKIEQKFKTENEQNEKKMKTNLKQKSNEKNGKSKIKTEITEKIKQKTKLKKAIRF